VVKSVPAGGIAVGVPANVRMPKAAVQAARTKELEDASQLIEYMI
jgi:serine O-acetyltransferase